MARICITISNKTTENLQKISADTGKSYSRVASELVELGLSIYSNNPIQEQQNLSAKAAVNVGLNNTEYLIRILCITSNILRKLHNEPLKCSSNTIEDMLLKFKEHAKKMIEDKTKGM